MADTTQTAPAEAGNGQVSRAELRAQTLAEIQKLASDPGPNSEGEKPAEVPAPAPEEPAEPAEPAEEQPEEPADDDGDAGSVDPDEEPTKPAAAAKDPDLEKRLEVVQRAQKRAKEELAKERAELEQERTRWKGSIEQAERFLQLASRAKYDPVGVLLALGLTEDDLEPAARQVYAHSKAAAADPRYKESATRLMRERQYADELQQTRKELAEMKQQFQQREQAQAAEREAARFLESVAKAAGDETPLVRTMLAKNAERTRDRLAQTAMRIIEETGEAPDPEDVVKALELARRNELEELGIDVETAVKAAPKKTIPAAGEKRTATKTLTADLGTPTKPRTAPKSRKEELAEVRAALESGQLE